MTTLALDSTHLTLLRRQAMADAPRAHWTLALCAAHPQVHGRYNVPAFALALHAPTVAGWLYLARRFGHVSRIPRRNLVRSSSRHLASILRAALLAANDAAHPALARWLVQVETLRLS